MKKLILCAIAAAALSSGAVAFAQAGSVGEAQQELYPRPYGNSGWTPDQAYGGNQRGNQQKLDPRPYGNSGWTPDQAYGDNQYVRPRDDRHRFVAPPPRADWRNRGDRDGDHIRNRDDNDRDGDGVANRRDRYPDDARRR